MMSDFDFGWIRAQFPALVQPFNHQPAIFFDGPGGTQVPQTVIDAIAHYLITSNANAHGAFATSDRTDTLVQTARQSVADLLNCDPDEVVFGPNMTSLTFAISRAMGRELQPGDEIIVTPLDHYANVSSWEALTERGVIIRTVNLNLEDCTLDLTDLERLLNSRTRLVAIGYASNAVGTINDVEKIVQMAHQVGALAFVDAVHYAPHGLMDVRALDCDFLTCSAYKFFGPHIGILYGKRSHLENLRPYKVQPAPDEAPSRWETGTQNYEAMAGLVAAIAYLKALGQHVDPSAQGRDALIVAMRAIQAYEQELSRELINGLEQIPGLTIYGITDSDRLAWRTPTFGIRLARISPADLAKKLGDRGIFTWHGNLYALGLSERLGLESSGGFLRIGLVHYNTRDEIQRFLAVLQEIAAAQLTGAER